MLDGQDVRGHEHDADSDHRKQQRFRQLAALTLGRRGVPIEIRRLDVGDPASVAEGVGTNVLGPMRVIRAVLPVWRQPDYFDRATRFRQSQGVLTGDGPPPDPQDVPDAIVRAALDVDAPFRSFVGDDAQLIHSVESSMPFEEFEAVMRDTLDWHE